MAQSNLKTRILDDVKAAMRAGEKARLGTLRLITAAIKQQEVDRRVELDDAAVLAVLDKMAKQRRESIEQYEKAGRSDLVDGEKAELEIITGYLPQALSEAEISALIDEAIESTGAETIKDMGKVMGFIKPKAQGRADMSQLSAQVKARLG